MRSSITATIAAAALALHANAAYNYVECANVLIANNLLTGLVNVVTTALSSANSVTGCPVSLTLPSTTTSTVTPTYLPSSC